MARVDAGSGEVGSMMRIRGGEGREEIRRARKRPTQPPPDMMSGRDEGESWRFVETWLVEWPFLVVPFVKSFVASLYIAMI